VFLLKILIGWKQKKYGEQAVLLLLCLITWTRRYCPIDPIKLYLKVKKMATTPEGKVKKRVKDVLVDLCAYYTMPVTGGYGVQGVPDFIICWKGLFFGVECKAKGNKPTALQEQNMTKIRNAGGRTIVINEDNVEHLETWMRTHEITDDRL
jgi:hypothetical protein